MDEEQERVADVLRSMPPPDVRGDFVARVRARIEAMPDAAPGWFGLADFRAWTLRLAPVAFALGLVGVFWKTPSSPASSASASVVSPAAFSPSSSSDWQNDVSGDAMLEAALAPGGGSRGR
jgi:hypothetical protein